MTMGFMVKQEQMTADDLLLQVPTHHPSSSFINSTLKQEKVTPEEEEDQFHAHINKKMKLDHVDPGTPLNVVPLSQIPMMPSHHPQNPACKQFWKAGDYEVPPTSSLSTGGLDHVRVHPRFLHSNATSHKWVLGAFAELLDNSVDEISHGATYAIMDVLTNQKHGGKMLLVQDDGGGMDMDVMRHCMSFGYSAKSKLGNTIGQYGNGFKTSTMRLGADVIVFTRCPGRDGQTPTQSIGMLSYTFLRSTGKADIVVPILDYHQAALSSNWSPVMRSSLQDWRTNLESILEWSPYSSEAELLRQFDLMEEQGTRVVVYNLWEDDQGKLELDFDNDPHDIQIRGVNKDQNMINMANTYPSSRHYLTYQHSLRSYTSILYLRLPPEFKIILRGEPVDHHNIVDDMMLTERLTYRPQVTTSNGVQKHVATSVTLGFVKDAKHHIDVQGFNIYHKNRLIKPFWRILNAASSDGRGVVGVLEANFVEPAHDKQGFENTPVLERLRTRLLGMQREYWRERSHEVGYALRVKRRRDQTEASDDSPKPSSSGEESPDHPSLTTSKRPKAATTTCQPKTTVGINAAGKEAPCSTEPVKEDQSQNIQSHASDVVPKETVRKTVERFSHFLRSEKEKRINLEAQLKDRDLKIEALQKETESSTKNLEAQIKEKDLKILALQKETESSTRNLEAQLKEKDLKIQALQRETESLMKLLVEEKTRQGDEVAFLKNKLTEGCAIIQALKKRMTAMESKNAVSCKQEPY